MGHDVLKNWKPKKVITFLKKNGFILKKVKGDHYCFYNPDTHAYTEVDYGRSSFSAREMLTFVKQSRLARGLWISPKTAPNTEEVIFAADHDNGGKGLTPDEIIELIKEAHPDIEM